MSKQTSNRWWREEDRRKAEIRAHEALMRENAGKAVEPAHVGDMLHEIGKRR
jgi:hypothetical protein